MSEEGDHIAQLKTLERLAEQIQADCRARDIEIGQLAALGERLGEMLTRTQEVCEEAYLAVGQLVHMAGVWNAPEVVKLLDNLLAASNGEPIPHATILPFAPERVPCGECHLQAGERCDICGAMEHAKVS